MVGTSDVDPFQVEIRERVGITPIRKGCPVSCSVATSRSIKRESGNVLVATYTPRTRPFTTNGIKLTPNATLETAICGAIDGRDDPSEAIIFVLKQGRQ